MAANPALTQQASRGRDDPVITGLVTRARNGEQQAWDTLRAASRHDLRLLAGNRIPGI